MKDFNIVGLIGRLTKDTQIAYMSSGSAKLDLSIAFNTSKKEGNNLVDESNFLNVTLWGKTAENLAPYLKKGVQVALNGHLHQDKYEKDGQTKTILKVFVDDIQLLGGKKEGGASVSVPKTTPKEAPVTQPMGDDFPEDIPF